MLHPILLASTQDQQQKVIRKKKASFINFWNDDHYKQQQQQQQQLETLHSLQAAIGITPTTNNYNVSSMDSIGMAISSNILSMLEPLCFRNIHALMNACM
jgi:hypothetical protein